jgi:hypothetical protein
MPQSDQRQGKRGFRTGLRFHRRGQASSTPENAPAVDVQAGFRADRRLHGSHRLWMLQPCHGGFAPSHDIPTYR